MIISSLGPIANPRHASVNVGEVATAQQTPV